MSETQKAGSITAGRLDADALELIERSHPRDHRPISLPCRGKRLTGQDTVVFVHDGRDMQVLVGIDAANDTGRCSVINVQANLLDQLLIDSFARTECADRTVTRPTRSSPSRVTSIGEAKPHRRAFPGGRQVQGKTRLVDRSVVRPHRGALRASVNAA